MHRYIRAFVPGGTFFFTVALLERRRQLLTEYIGELRAAFAAARSRKVFTVNSIVVLPDHLHCTPVTKFADLTLNDPGGGMRSASRPTSARDQIRGLDFE